MERSFQFQVRGRDAWLDLVFFTSANESNAGEVVHTGKGETILEGGSEELQRMLTEAGITSRVCTAAEAKEAAWRKLVVNLAINPLTAVLGVQNGALVADEYRPAIASIVREALAARGESTADENINSYVDQVVKVAQATSQNTSSMLADLQRRTTTEHDHLLWSAKQLDVKGELPIQSFMKQLISARQLIKV